MDGTGTKDDPYIIMSIEDLVKCSKEASEGKLANVYINLGRNLNFKSDLSYCDTNTKEYNEFLGITDNVGIKEALTNTKYNGFKPIEGIKASSFQGNNYTIKNLWEHVSNNSGLFSNSQIEILNLTLTGNIICDGDCAGGILSVSQSTSRKKIENCKSYVDIKSNGVNTAGILASPLGTEINNCINYGNIEGKNTVAGIVNYFSKATNCINYGNIKGTEYVAGISSCYTTVIDCKNFGKIEGERCVGGIITKITNNTNIIGAINYGQVKGNSDVGGIIAALANKTSELANLINYADIEGISNVGGIAGEITDLGLLANSVNFGNVKGEKFVAGIAGNIAFTQGEQNEIYNCYTVGNIEGTTNVCALVGAKTGYGTHYLKYCYWKKELNLEYGSATVPTTWGILQAENTTAYEDSYLKSQDFVNILNENVKKINEERKDNENFVKLSEWRLSSDNGYPSFE